MRAPNRCGFDPIFSVGGMAHNEPASGDFDLLGSTARLCGSCPSVNITVGFTDVFLGGRVHAAGKLRIKSAPLHHVQSYVSAKPPLQY